MVTEYGEMVSLNLGSRLWCDPLHVDTHFNSTHNHHDMISCDLHPRASSQAIFKMHAAREPMLISREGIVLSTLVYYHD